jgi:pyrimidine-nucleoside phosphorylase/thymidine phosphorylase
MSGQIRAYEIIKAKRDGTALPPEVLEVFLQRYTRGEVPDYQMAAFCMAVFFRGMTEGELAAWTRAMLESGDVLDFSDIPGAKVDKHSTGGVGDKVSIALAPLAAACGVKVPMISGRGLGHTGGTLDKLESIPGFQIQLDIDRFREIVKQVGACLIGQTERLAPADKRIYALRDVTATVECIPLIASSIMSKKLAEGIDALVLDVKVGSGAFMKTAADAQRLAYTLCAIGRGMGKRVSALLTAMDQPLGEAVGNALEVIEAVQLLHGKGPADLREVTVELAVEMLALGNPGTDRAQARKRVEGAIADGSAFRKLLEIVEAQGGDSRALEDLERLPRAKGKLEVPAPASGVVEAIDCEAIGQAAMALGAGRATVEQDVDHGVGILVAKKVGQAVERGEPLCTLHWGERGTEPPARVSERILAAYRIGPKAPPASPLILERIT